MPADNRLRRLPVVLAVILMIILLSSGEALVQSWLGGGQGRGDPRAFAAALTLIKKIGSSDLEDNDHFGYAVAFDANTIVVGATQEDGGPGDPTTSSGAVYIFERNEGGPDNWGEIVRLTASDSDAYASFGYSVAIDGDTIVVGAYRDDNGGSTNDDYGAAYVFERNEGGPGQWGETAKLIASEKIKTDQLGFSIDIDGDTIVVGADPRGSNPIYTVIFERNMGGPGSWGEVKNIETGPAGLNAGIDVAVSGDTLVVGDPLWGLSGNGKAWIYERDLGGPDNWGERGFVVSGSSKEDKYNFGESVAIYGDTIVVGSTRETGGLPSEPLTWAGAAYVFERDLGGPENWGEASALKAADPSKSAMLGIDVSIMQDFIIVGADRADDNNGAAYLFSRDHGGAGNWGQVLKFASGVTEPYNHYGAAVSVSGDEFVVGAPEENVGEVDPLDEAGAAYIYGFAGLTPTATQTPSPTATITPIPPGQINFLPIVRQCVNLYYDDFSSQSSGWPIINSGDVLFQYIGGEYRLFLKNKDWFAAATPGEDFSSYLLQARVRNIGGLNGNYGLLFGRKSGWVGFYTFEITPNGTYLLWRYDGGGAWVLLKQGASLSINKGAASNNIAVERNGSSIRGFANGVELFALNDSTHLGVLGVGIVANSFGDENLDIRYDNYTVLPIGCGLSEGQGEAGVQVPAVVGETPAPGETIYLTGPGGR